jgi:polysaccharide biosynthesis/export protein
MKSFLLVFCIVFLNEAIVFPFQAASTNTASKDFIIGLEDVLSVNVWKEPDFSVREVVVRPDGRISLPLIGDIQASGLTTKQLQEQISKLMEKFVDVPNVTVVVLKIVSQSVSVIGQVAKPGPYYLGSPLTVLDVLARAGGFREEAKTKKITIIRKESKKTTHFRFNYSEVSKGQNLQQNIVLMNGDVVVVP